MTERDRRVIYYYYCLFGQNKNLYYEFYERTFLGRTQVYHRFSAKGHDFINSSYHEAIHIYGIDTEISKTRFEELITQDGFYNPRKYGKHFPHWLYTQHRVPTHFVKKNHHRKKEISEEVFNKREWRKKKGFSKDQTKVKTWKRNAGKYYKQMSNQMHRAWVKNEMYHERELCNNDYKWFIDKWMWS